MAYGVIMCCHLHMPLYILGTFTEYPFLLLVGYTTLRLLFIHFYEKRKNVTIVPFLIPKD